MSGLRGAGTTSGSPFRGMGRRQLLAGAAALATSGAASASLSACSGSRRRAQTAEGQQAAEGGGLGRIYTAEAAKELNRSLQWPASTVDEPSSEVTVTVAHAWDASFLPRQKQFDAFFMERHPNIKVERENTPWADYLQKYLTQIAGGTAPDMMYCHNSWAQNFARRGLFSALDDYIDRETEFELDDFTEPSLPFYEQNGRLFGLAYDCGPTMLFYNKDIFDAGGITYPRAGWTLEDVRDAAIELSGGSGSQSVFGLSQIPYPNNIFTPVRLAPFGGAFLSEDETHSLLNEPSSVEAARWWMDIYHDHHGMPSPADQQAITAGAFTVGRAAMHVDGSWAVPGLLEQADFQWAIAEWPPGPDKHVTAAAGSAYAILEQSENKDAAWVYLNEYLSTAGQVFMWGTTGRGSPARNSAWPSYLESEFAPQGAELVQEALNSYATSRGVLHQPTTPEVVNAATPIWDRVVSGDLSVDEGCRDISAEVDPLLEDNRD